MDILHIQTIPSDRALIWPGKDVIRVYFDGMVSEYKQPVKDVRAFKAWMKGPGVTVRGSWPTYFLSMKD